MATALSVMTRLESLDLEFPFSRSRPDPASRPLPPPTHFVLPALTKLSEAFMSIWKTFCPDRCPSSLRPRHPIFHGRRL